MPVFFSPHSDIILSVLSIGLLLAGTLCIAISRETDITRPLPSWRYLGVAMIILAAREWLGIIGVSEPTFVSWYPSAAFMQTLAAIFVLAAARIESAGDSRRLTVTHALITLLLVVLLAVIAEPYLSYSSYIEQRASLVSTFIFFLVKASLVATSILFAYCTWRNTIPSSRDVKAVTIVFCANAILILLCLPPGLPATLSLIDTDTNEIVLILFLLRIVLAFLMAIIAWNTYAKSLQVTGQIRWWPMVFMLFMVFIGSFFVWISASNYEKVVRSNLAAAARNAARSIPVDILRDAAATRGSANNRGVAYRIFNKVRELEFFSGYTRMAADVDALAYLPERNEVIPILDIIHHPDGGLWARSGRPVREYWDDYRLHGKLHQEERLASMVIMAPLRTPEGAEAGLVVLSASITDLALEMYAFKRLPLLTLPLAFLVLLLLVSGQQRAWLASHSSNRDEAMRLGALGNGLVGVCIKRGSTVIDVNQRMSEILGIPKAELLGRDALHLTNLLSPEVSPQLEEWLNTPEQPGAISFESVVHRPDGGEAHLLVLGRTIAFMPGEPHSIWECVDITRIKEMEGEVRAARDRLQMVLDTMPVAVFVKDRNGRYQMVNQRFASLFSFENVEDVLGKTAAEIYGADPETARAHDEICVDMRGETLVYDQGFRFADGQRFFELSKTMRWLGDDRENYVIIGSVHDLTERKRAEDAIKAERHFLMQLINTLPVSVCFLDKDRILRVCNSEFCREAGVDEPGEVIGKHYDDVAPFGPILEREEQAMLSRGSGFSDTEFEMEKNGRMRNFMLRRSVMQSTTGEALGLVKTFWDTTALVAANRAAKKADRAKAAFLANMSHELRTPMNGIVGMADLIIDHESTEPVQRLYAETVIKSAKTLQMVMDEVMNVATMDEGGKRFILHPAPFPLLPLTEEAVQIVSCIVEAWGVELSLVYDFGLPGFLEGDSRHIRQIIVQVLTHCSRLAEDKRIRLEISPGGGVTVGTVFRPVADLGPEELESMFKSPDGETSTLNLGMFNNRIGLPLVWHLVQIMGGSLDVLREGADIRCRIRLPLEAPEDRPASSPAAPDLSCLRVLTATSDDDRSTALRRALEYARADTTTTGDGDSVIAEMRKTAEKGQPYELLILDSTLVKAGDLPGFLDVLSRQLPKKPAVMAIVSSREVQNLGRVGGVLDSLLLPPICPGELWNKIDAILKGSVDTGCGAPESTATRHSSRIIRTAQIPAKVLLVEDNTVNQMVAMGILKRIGCNPALAKNGREAVDRIAGGEVFDLILMDCMMPIMDGYEATSHIRMHERSRSGVMRNIIIALTANTVSGDREKCLAAGMDDYITKPVTLELVRDVIRKHCPWLATAADGVGRPEG